MSKKKTPLIIIVSLAIVVLLAILEVYHCPITIIFGISCPTCGMTRAIISAIQLDFVSAFHYHLFWPVVIIGFIIFILYILKLIHLNKKVLLVTAYIICILNLIYYLYRLFSGSDIIYFNFTESLIYKIIKLF